MKLPLWPLWVDPQEIVDQRAKGWPDLHPEDFCHRCGQRNVQAWAVDGTLWNRVYEVERANVLCPQCFTEALQRLVGRTLVWELRLSEHGAGFFPVVEGHAVIGGRVVPLPWLLRVLARFVESVSR